MLIAAILPYISFLTSYIGVLIPRVVDSGSFCNQVNTKLLTVQQYVNLYAGPEVDLHYRYSAVLNQVFVCFTHGLALPLLFPITLFGMLNLYIVERLQFAYFYR